MECELYDYPGNGHALMKNIEHFHDANLNITLWMNKYAGILNWNYIIILFNITKIFLNLIIDTILKCQIKTKNKKSQNKKLRHKNRTMMNII